MFQRISNGWMMSKQSWRVLMLDKELLIFPLLSGIACLLVLASFAIPLWTSGAVDRVEDDPSAANQPLTYVVTFLFYFCNYFVIVFFNSALVACAVIRFRGGDPTLGDGFRAAFSRLPQIAAWAFVSATVGLILHVIESRSQRVGKFVAGLLGSVWSIGTYFVVPVLVVEKTGPFAAVRKSLSILRKTWGEAIVANFGIWLFVFLLLLACLVLPVLGILLASKVTIVVGVVAALVGGILVCLISSALNAIILGALYLYASDGAVPAHFDNQFLQYAFASK